MAYRAEIQIGVVGLKLLEDLERRLVGINSLVTRLNKTAKNPVINTQNITSVSSSVANLNKQLQQTLSLQQQISKQRIPAAPPGPSGGGGGRAGGGGRPSPSGKKGSNIGSAISSAAIGGAFPLLFGQGAGAAVGGAIGGVAGELALGPAGGFAGSLIGTAVGAAADADIAVAKLAANLGLAGEAADQFGQSFRTAGVDLQAFTQAVNGIREINVTLEQQATAIQIATAVSGNYKGSITAVATALQDIGTSGEVSLGTLQSLTAANVPIVQSLATTFGVTKDKVLEMAADGRISVAQLVEELRKLGNQSKEQTALDKLSQSFSNLTASVTKVYGPVLEGVGNVLGGVLDRLSTGFGYVADVLMPKFVKAIEPIKTALAGAFPGNLLNKIAGFFQNVLLTALEGVVFVLGKLTPAVAFVLTKFKELSNNPVFKFIADQVLRLANFLGLSGSRTDEYANKQANAAKQTATTADKARELANALAQASVVQLEKNKQILAATDARLSAEENIINARLQITTSLNQEVALLQRAGQIRQQRNAAELQAAYNTAEASVKKAIAEGKGVDAAKEKAATDIQIAHSKYEESRIVDDIATKQKIVAAYAADYARQTERTVHALEQQSATINNQLNLITTINQAQTEINNARVSMLRMELETTTNYSERTKIINRIYALDKANAKLKYESTIAQIKAEVAQQQIAYKMAEAKYAELLAVVKIAEAQGVVNEAHYQALDAQASALNIAKDALDVTYKTAAAQLKAADAVYRTNVALLEQARLKEQAANTAAGFGGKTTQTLTYSAEEAKSLGIGPYADRHAGGQSAATYTYLLEEAKKAMTLEERIADIYTSAYQAADSIALYEDGSYGLRYPDSIVDPTLTQFEDYSIGTAYAKGGYVTGATSALIGEAGPEYVIPAGKMEEAMARYASGRRGSSVIPDAASSGAGDYSAGTSSINPVVNVTTGPVMNMNNSNYVSQADFLAGLQAASRQGAQMALATLQNNSSTRRAVGVR